ncbi:aminotransferase class I/II-fold pyridoxal phosphate-dependent enzyme [Bacillus rubiinfantis]|uniref:aminotransferase class I/II-fold pyridoxal phosphate-dependent enzyme n=1 Tax=Bacillus rubiinfantis TaxID=1499680 RepID=UPI0005A7B49B|nr:aminotransferase class I/II-fold pyridoxal phosphate-dependent enzyme [Bacillus rubiinfantis]
MDAQSRLPIVQALMGHAEANPISFHVPGHKYGQIFTSHKEYFKQLLKLDVTELSGLDDLHAAEGVILEAETLLTEVFQVQKSYFMINGSTVGNLSMIMAACTEGDTVLVQRNCHKSVLHALRLAKANPIFLEPEYNPEWKVAEGIGVSTVNRAISLYPEAKAIILTYPNYYGMVYDLQGIIDEAHDFHIPVLVDEAHGAHFIVGSPFPTSAVKMGADIVVQSAHKTLPAMTMGAFLHFNSKLLFLDRVKYYLEIFQSSSPSYPIMASLDVARFYLATYNYQDRLFLQEKIQQFKNLLVSIPQIKVLDYPEPIGGDLLKVTIQSCCSLNGYELQKQLEAEAIYTELADPENVLLVLPLLKTDQEFPLETAAAKIKLRLAAFPTVEKNQEYTNISNGVSSLALDYKTMSILPSREIHIKEAAGEICAEQITPYPPGIPLLLEGELITEGKLHQLRNLLVSGAKFQGGTALKQGRLKVFYNIRM